MPVDQRDPVARRFMAQDARWIADAVISSQETPWSGIVPFALIGHSSRVVYEGLRAVTDGVGKDLTPLTELLPAAHSPTITRARHATKLLDDNKKSLVELATELSDYYTSHNRYFVKSIKPWLRWLAYGDLGLYRSGERILVATIPAQFRTGFAPDVLVDDLGPLLHKVSVEQGEVLAVLAAMDGGSVDLKGTLNYAPLGDPASEDHACNEYLGERFDSAIDIGTKLLLLMIQSELSNAASVLPLTAPGHEEAEFRARFLSLYHSLSGLQKILEDHPSACSTQTLEVRSLVASDDAQRFLNGRGMRSIRNRCMHYQIPSPGPEFRLDEPLCGLVELLSSQATFDEINRLTSALVQDACDVVTQWST